MNRQARIALALAAASCAGLLAASSAPDALAAAIAASPSSAPASPADRLDQLDQLHADLELAKLRAAIAKANAEAREAAAGPVVGAAGGPPLPSLGSNSAMINFPPIPPVGPAAGEGLSKDRTKSGVAQGPLFTLVEAWGSGAERQAILHSDAGDRLVRVGDRIPLGVVTAISGGVVTYRDAHGRDHAID
jgi:hypothetical protein